MSSRFTTVVGVAVLRTVVSAAAVTVKVSNAGPLISCTCATGAEPDREDHQNAQYSKKRGDLPRLVYQCRRRNQALALILFVRMLNQIKSEVRRSAFGLFDLQRNPI